MNNKIEERFNPPFAVFENLVGNYIVRPLEWEGIWNPDGKLVGGNSIVCCPIKEDAEMIADAFNRFFDQKKQLEVSKSKLLLLKGDLKESIKKRQETGQHNFSEELIGIRINEILNLIDGESNE